jgi:RNA polymerase sigma factor (sigma-70 family)
METLTASSLPEAGASPSVVVGMQANSENRQTLREVFESQEAPLLRYAFGLVGQRETAEDLVQEAFLRLHAHWHEVANPRAWLFRSIRNLSLNHLRDHRRETSLETAIEPESPAADPRRALTHGEALGTLQLLLAELPDEERSLIGLKYRDGLKYEQISQRTGLSVGNVGYKLHHLLKDLAESLRRLGIESSES